MDSGTFVFTVLARRDSASIALYEVEYSDSVLHSRRPYGAPDSPWTRVLLRARDTTRCVGDGDSVHCDPIGGGDADNSILPMGPQTQTISLPGIGMIWYYDNSILPHSPPGNGSRTEIRLVAMNGGAVDYREYADLCSRDFPVIPAP